MRYWTSDWDAQLAAQQDSIEQQRASIRDQLIRRYGDVASGDPAFARVFRPLDSRFPYLSSRAQITLAAQMRARQGSPAPATGPLVQAANPRAAIEQQRAFDRQLRSALGNTDYFEYQLRESSAARQLRSSGVVRDEEEFRRIFGILQRAEDNPSIQGILAAQRELNSALGENRYVEFSASRDPAFDAIQSSAEQFRLPREKVLAAYGVLLKAQSSLLAAGTDLSTRGDQQRILEQRDEDRCAWLVTVPHVKSSCRIHSTWERLASQTCRA